MMLPKTAAIIVAAGSSTRFGQDKLVAMVHGEPLIRYSLNAFAQTPLITSIILVVPPGREEEFSQIVASTKNPSLTAMTQVVAGGVNRHQSVQYGIAALASSVSFVAIHDGARPLITPALIEQSLYEAYSHGAAALALAVTETLHRANANGDAEETIDRTHLWAMQTPQVFRVSDLVELQAEYYLKSNVKAGAPTDEVSALLQRGIKIHLVENREPNIKVTYPADLALVEASLSVARKR